MSGDFRTVDGCFAVASDQPDHFLGLGSAVDFDRNCFAIAIEDRWQIARERCNQAMRVAAVLRDPALQIGHCVPHGSEARPLLGVDKNRVRVGVSRTADRDDRSQHETRDVGISATA